MIRKSVYLLGMLASFMAFSQQDPKQQKAQLQRQTNELKKQISELNSRLAKTQKEARLSVAYLNDVNKKIALREKVYKNTEKEKIFIEDDIYAKQRQINKYKKDLEILRKKYAEVLVKAYKNKGVQNKVTFILSSQNFGQALRRVQYLKSYSEYQENKAAEILGVTKQIQNTLSEKEKSIKEKEALLANQQKDLNIINQDRKQKELLLQEFKKNEAQLTTEIKQKQVETKALEGKLKAIIAEEIRLAKAKEEAERKEREEKARLARIAAEKEKARIEAENRARIAAAEEAKRKAEEEARKLKEIAEKKAAEEAERARLAALAEAKKLEDARKTAEAEKAEARRLAAARDAAEAAAKAKAAAEKAAEARATEAALAKKNEEAKKAAEARTMTAFGVGAATGSNFAESRGRIASPVSGGRLSHRFGKQPHPVYDKVSVEHNGIGLTVPAGTTARCVFPGVVSRIIVDGGTKTVVIKHGNYFTIYSNLQSTSVSANQQVAAGTPVGVVGADFDGTYTLDFQIWNGTTPIDPLGWISY